MIMMVGGKFTAAPGGSLLLTLSAAANVIATGNPAPASYLVNLDVNGTIPAPLLAFGNFELTGSTHYVVEAFDQPNGLGSVVFGPTNWTISGAPMAFSPTVAILPLSTSGIVGVLQKTSATGGLADSNIRDDGTHIFVLMPFYMPDGSAGAPFLATQSDPATGWVKNGGGWEFHNSAYGLICFVGESTPSVPQIGTTKDGMIGWTSLPNDATTLEVSFSRIGVKSVALGHNADSTGKLTLDTLTTTTLAFADGTTQTEAAGPLAAPSTVAHTTNFTGNLRVAGAIAPAGLYEVSIYMVVTVPNTTGTLDVSIGWNDGTAARTATNGTNGMPADISTAATNMAQGSVVVLADGVNDITYAFTITQTLGTASYSAFASLRRIG